MRAINWLFKRVVKVRVEGPIDMRIQQKILQQLNKVKPSNCQALVLIINSYGGSLRAATNISQALLNLKYHKIPVYCFAEQFCLNSANVILTSATQCYASKFSVLGDFGYVYDNYNFEQFSHKFNVGVQQISLSKPTIDIFAKNYQLNNPQFIQKWLQMNSNDLRNTIVQNRGSRIKNGEFFKSKKGGEVAPFEAQELGLIDGVQTCQQFIRFNFNGHRIKEQKQYREYRAINFLRNTLEIFRKE